MDDAIRLLHISDTHWSSEPIAPGIDSRSRLDALCDWIQAFSDPIDFIAHTGDWVHRGHIASDPGRSTQEAWRRLAKLGIPILTAVGNHDNRKTLSECMLESLPSHLKIQCIHAHPDRLDYWFSLDRGNLAQESFLVLDARGAQEIDPRGELSEQQIVAIEELFRRDPSRTWTIFLHYPPIALDCDWIDRTMLIQNGERLHAVFSANSYRIRGVFFGHIHRPICCLRDGVLYASTGSTAMHFPNLPGATKAVMQSDPVAFANYIRINNSGALVKTQWTIHSI
jgi:3',5'-cyclic AMP phosphodiesterase CpdA